MNVWFCHLDGKKGGRKEAFFSVLEVCNRNIDSDSSQWITSSTRQDTAQGLYFSSIFPALKVKKKMSALKCRIAFICRVKYSFKIINQFYATRFIISGVDMHERGLWLENAK